MVIPSAGDIVVLPFPFSDLSESKVRQNNREYEKYLKNSRFKSSRSFLFVAKRAVCPFINVTLLHGEGIELSPIWSAGGNDILNRIPIITL